MLTRTVNLSPTRGFEKRARVCWSPVGDAGTRILIVPRWFAALNTNRCPPHLDPDRGAPPRKPLGPQIVGQHVSLDSLLLISATTTTTARFRVFSHDSRCPRIHVFGVPAIVDAGTCTSCKKPRHVATFKLQDEQTQW